jgi:hypothetical protein
MILRQGKFSAAKGAAEIGARRIDKLYSSVSIIFRNHPHVPL